MSPMQTAKSANPQTAMSAAEKAAKMELKTAKLKMEMAAAKLAYVRAVAAYEAAKSGEDTALGEKTIPSFSTRADEILKPKGLQLERKQRRRSPAYAKRLQRRRKEREDAKEDKERAAENAVIVRFAARRCSELRVTKRREEKKEELRLQAERCLRRNAERQAAAKIAAELEIAAELDRCGSDADSWWTMWDHWRQINHPDYKPPTPTCDWDSD